MRSVPVVGSARRGVFTFDEALAAGWMPDALARAVHRGDIVRLRRGIYVSASHGAGLGPARRCDVELAQRSIAASLTSGHIAVSALASVELYGWPVWAPQPRSCVTVTDNRTRVPGAHVHRTPLGTDVAPVAGSRITRPTRTVLDVACEFGTEAGLVVADAAMAQGLTSVERLTSAVDAGRGRTGIAAARPLPTLVDPRAESPLESRSRWAFVVHALPVPQTQTVIVDEDGRFIARTDFSWPEGVVGEVDGGEKLTDPGARRALLERQSRLMRAGLRIVRWRESDLRSFASTAAWIREELAAAAADRRPRRWRPELAAQVF